MPPSTTSYVMPDPCDHKPITGCMLTALPCCCSCADKRPQATAYPVYIDGQGMRMKGRRWQRYCRKCYDFYESLATERQDAESSDAPIINIPTNPFATPAQHTNNATSTPEETIAHRRRRRERQNHALGTIEDVQQDDYVSPITGMFTRAYDRFRVAEEVRQAEARFTTMHLSELPGGPPALTSLPIAQRRQQQRSNFHRQFYHHHQDPSSPLASLPHPEPDPMDDGPNPVDLQTLQRPTPSTAESLKVDFACKVCCEQKVNVINEPCMHACMCQWCASILRSECRNEQGRFDGRLWRCPICRARITQVRKFYIE